MARIYLYTDLSPSRAWLFATIHANRDLLTAQSINLGPFSPWSCEIIPSHTHFWSFIPEEKNIPYWMLNQINEIKTLVDAKHDILLMSNSSNMLCHRSLNNRLRQYLDLDKHDVHVIFIIGRPICALEQLYREAHELLERPMAEQFIEWYTKLPILIMDAQREWGREKVTILPNLSSSPTTSFNMQLAEQLFAWLGCPAPHPPARLPRHPLFFQSHSARRLNWTLEVRENAWPRIDEVAFINALASLDKEWGTAPVSPLKIRQSFLQKAQVLQTSLEKILCLDSGALDAPEWLSTQAEEEFYSPLAEDRLISFVEALPQDVSTALAQRYANDSHLLTQDQQALFHALSLNSPKQNIGEPELPVELTVLTMTYNHEKYIAECMESVLAQKTSFPVQHIVLDHNSTDSTPEIITAYAQKYSSIRPVLLSFRRHPENITGLFLRCRTKYAALCDGDDYFIDPLKLQKQVDFLKNHPRCSLCFHPVAVVFENGQQPGVFPPLKMLPRGVREEYHLADLFKGNMIQTNTVVYRWRFQEGLPDWFRPDLCPGDWYWHLLHAEQGRIGFLPDIMSVYRRHANALYKDSFVNQVEHRKIHGMAELETYYTVNQHFQNRYFRSLALLANGVFSNFFQISLTENNQYLLNQACEKYPSFAKFFMESLKIIKNESVTHHNS